MPERLDIETLLKVPTVDPDLGFDLSLGNLPAGVGWRFNAV